MRSNAIQEQQRRRGRSLKSSALNGTLRTKGRRPKKYSQADRLSRMMRALAARALTVNELAEEFSITRRQVYRDLNQIEAEGHPLVQDADVGERIWRLPLGYKGLPPITVSPYELLSIHIARAHLSYLDGTPFLEDLDTVIKKIQAGLPVKTTNHLDRIVDASFHIARPTRSYQLQRSILGVLRRALLLQRTVVLYHRVPGYSDAVAHALDPYVLLLYQQGLYVLGRSHRSCAIRLFAVERVKDAVLMDKTFEVPPNFSVSDVDRRLFGLIDEEPQDVRIEFREEIAYLLRERRWHPTQTLTRGNKGKVLVTFHAGGQDELASWVLSWGSKAKVLTPASLVNTVMKELEATLKQYKTRQP